MASFMCLLCLKCGHVCLLAKINWLLSLWGAEGQFNPKSKTHIRSYCMHLVCACVWIAQNCGDIVCRDVCLLSKITELNGTLNTESLLGCHELVTRNNQHTLSWTVSYKKYFLSMSQKEAVLLRCFFFCFVYWSTTSEAKCSFHYIKDM